MPKGEKTKQLWLDEKYRYRMINAHKGQKAWNKTNIFMFCKMCNKKFRIVPCLIGLRKYCSKACGDIGYNALHKWVRKQFGKAGKCSFDNTHKGRYEWANKSRKYKRITSDWIELCNKCHQKYDSKKKKIWKS